MNYNPFETSHVATNNNCGNNNNNNHEHNRVITTGSTYQSPPSGDSLNTALDDLGLLSSVTCSRRQYLLERDVFYGRLASLTMTDSQPGPSQSTPRSQSLSSSSSSSSTTSSSSGNSSSGHAAMPSPDQISTTINSNGSVSSQQCHFALPTGSFRVHPPTFSSPSEITNNFNFTAPILCDAKETTDTSRTEKENNLFAGFKVLTMNSKFVTSFKNDYSLPNHVSSASNNYQHPVCGPPIDKSKWYHKTCLRSIARRKRTRTHPYENSHVESSCQALYEMCVNEAVDSKSGNLEVPNCYRLRTTSLSSGVCGGKTGRRRRHLVGRAGPGAASTHHKLLGCCAAANAATNGVGLVRSRSMEDLSAELDIEATDMKALVTAIIRKKEVESVSRAIQQMCVQDSG